MPGIAFNEYDLVASICRDSFFDFVKEFWGEVITEDPVWNWHIKYLCDEAQIVAERVFAGLPKKYDLVINVSPGSTKSTIFSRMFPAWAWTRNPGVGFICGSFNYRLALRLSSSTRRIVQSEKYRAVFPDIELRDDQNTKELFENTKHGQRIACSVGGGITGDHAHFVIIDDPIDPQKAASETELANANTWINETLPTRVVNKEVAPTILIMQRLHENDATGMILAQSKKSPEIYPVKHICLPAEIDDATKAYPKELEEHYVDGLFDPIRLSRNVLRTMEAKLLEYGYSGQFRQNPIPRGGGMFKIDQIEIVRAPIDKPMLRVCRYWDKAGTHKGGAYTAGVKLGIDKDGFFWILDVVRGQWDASERERIIKQTAIMDGRNVPVCVEQEPGSGGKESAQATIRNLAGWSVTADNPTGDKTLRADPFSAQVNGGNVKMRKSAFNSDLVHEMMNFPMGKYKDQIDALTGAFKQIVSSDIEIGTW